MKNKIKFFIIFFLFHSFVLYSSNLKINSKFPDIKLNGKFLTSKEKSYLSLSLDKQYFSVDEIPSKYIVIEFINVYCFACQKQAPKFNKFYENLKNEDVKFIGIALGNTIKEIKIFKERFKIKFPIVPDENFKIYNAIGGTRTPFTIILKDQKIVYGHLGLIEGYDEIYSVILNKKQLAKIYQKEKYKPSPISDNMVIQKIKPKFHKIKDVKKEKNYYKVYADGKIFYVVVVSSPSVCNICHPVQFIYIVDEKGNIYDFIPVHLTKRFNKEWNQHEVDKMRSRLIGKNVFKGIVYNKKVDAVSAASITSSMIFYYINQAKNFLPTH